MKVPYVKEAQKRGTWTNTEIHGRLPRGEIPFSILFFAIKIVDAPNTSHDIVYRSHQLHNAHGCPFDKLQLYAQPTELTGQGENKGLFFIPCPWRAACLYFPYFHFGTQVEGASVIKNMLASWQRLMVIKLSVNE